MHNTPVNPPRLGSLYDLGLAMAEAFQQQLSPAEQDAARKLMYENMTGKPYRPMARKPN
jgi:hypothetical protein